MRTVLIALLLAVAFPALAEEVDVELVLAADGSGSIDNDELALQRRGYAEAITSAEVLAAIGAGPVGAIAITYVEWGGAASQHTIVDWHVVRDAASAGAVACGAAVPTAARNNITCSYWRANSPAAAHSGRPQRRPSRSSC